MAVVSVAKCGVCMLNSVPFWAGEKNNSFQITIFSVVQRTTVLEAKTYHIPYENLDLQKTNNPRIVA